MLRKKGGNPVDSAEQAVQVADTPAAPVAIAWEAPEGHLFWTQDSGWCPDPITPLTGSLFEEIIEPAFNAGWDTYELPFRSHCRRINTYLYYAQESTPDASPEQAEHQQARAHAKLMVAMDQLGEVWARDWLPEITAYLDEGGALAVHDATVPELLAQLEATLSGFRRVWDIHFQLVWPGFLAMSLFDELCRDLFGAEETYAAFTLLQGLDNKVLEADRALWQVAQEVGAAASVRAVLTSRPAGEVSRALRPVPGGQEFLAVLERFLQYLWPTEQCARRDCRSGLA